MMKHKSYKAIIKHISKGEDNAISLCDLSSLCGCRERETKLSVQKARLDGIIICSNEHGYFYPENLNDIWAFYKRYHSSALTTLTMIKHARAELVRNGIDVNS